MHTDQPTDETRPEAPLSAGHGAGHGATRSWWRRLRLPLLLFAVGLVGFSLPAWDRLPLPSPHFHFADLAESFLAGRLDTDTPNRHRGERPRDDDPPGLQEIVDRHLWDGDKVVGPNDWSSFRVITLTSGESVRGIFPFKDKHFRTIEGEERIIDVQRDVARTCGAGGRSLCDEALHYVSFPPFPAIAFLPFVAVSHYHFNDVIATVLLAALNLVLVFLLLEALRRRGWTERTRKENVLLAVLFAFGTVHYFSAVRGEVWFTALIMGVTLNIAFIWAALDARRPLLAGIFLALGMATRTPIAFCFVFFALQLLFPGGRWSGAPLREKLWKGALFATPVLAVGVALMWYNHARFGSYFEFGHTYLLEGTRASIRDHGLFSMHFLNQNLATAFANLPRLDGTKPFVHITRHGLSLLATTPFFLYLLWPKKEGWQRADRFRHLVLWLTVLFAAIPSLFYQNTGWAQFGYRFSLDWTPYLIVLLALSRRRYLTRNAVLLLAVCVIVNLFGAITFNRYGAFYYD